MKFLVKRFVVTKYATAFKYITEVTHIYRLADYSICGRPTYGNELGLVYLPVNYRLNFEVSVANMRNILKKTMNLQSPASITQLKVNQRQPHSLQTTNVIRIGLYKETMTSIV